MAGFRDFFSSLPLISQVDPYRFYIPGYTESLRLFSDVRVVMSEEWLSGVPLELQDYFYKVKFPCYFIPIFKGSDCYGFVLKGFTKMTPKFCTNTMLPGCERLGDGGLALLVEGIKDFYVPLLATKNMPVVVIPMLTALPSKDFLVYLQALGYSVVYIPDNDEHIQNHLARFHELCGKVGLKAFYFCVEGIKDFGDFFAPVSRAFALEQGKKLRGYLFQVLGEATNGR